LTTDEKLAKLDAGGFKAKKQRGKLAVKSLEELIKKDDARKRK
jgi:hypothetical protein